MSRLGCEHHTARFNQLPADIRNPLYSRSDYWDYYTGHIGPAGEEAGMLKRTQAELIVEALDSPAPASVLEYGCGDGVVLGGLLQRDPAIGAKRLAGVDSSGRMLDMARHRLRQGGRVELAPADARSAPLPFADRAFDAAYTCGALQHVPAAELPPILDELQRVARRKLVHWECFEAHRPTDGEHYTNPDTSRTIHESLLRRIGPVRMAVRDLRPISGQNSLLTSYELDRPLLTVLTFHAVGRPDPACESLDYRGMFVTPEELAQIVRVLRQGGWSFLTISQVQACARGERATPHKAVALTFDDGYESVFLDALPVLSQHGIKATAYITSDHISSRFSGATREGGGPPLPVMTEAQIRELADAGWDIGAHSCSHPVFLTLTPEQARREMTDSKARLEAITGRAVTSFAFPYGEPGVAFAPEQIDIARRVGFQTVMTMQPGLVDPAVNRPAWPRIGVGGDVWPEGLPARIAAIHRESSGWPATAPEPRQVLASRVRQVVRRCVQSGRTRVALYGAGRHTARLLSQTPLWPLQVVGLIDDDPSLAGTRRYGMPIYAPSDIASIRPEALVISSDQYEDAIYARLAPLESQGVSVHRLYGD
jgi:peptidoglycan/xylan/chitin deacetylase (PgdA/CDA1 family)/ubiquinone/menaquinone biosynthesis C-methylase UbiE